MICANRQAKRFVFLQKTDSLKHGHRRPRKTILCTCKFQKKWNIPFSTCHPAHLYIYIYVYIYMYISSSTHTYIHRYIHTCKHTRQWKKHSLSFRLSGHGSAHTHTYVRTYIQWKEHSLSFRLSGNGSAHYHSLEGSYKKPLRTPTRWGRQVLYAYAFEWRGGVPQAQYDA